MKHIQAVIYDLDNTLLDRTSTFRSFVQSLLNSYFCHRDDRDELADIIVRLDEDGYKDKRLLFGELLQLL